jgi:hypothetical protein
LTRALSTRIAENNMYMSQRHCHYPLQTFVDS